MHLISNVGYHMCGYCICDTVTWYNIGMIRAMAINAGPCPIAGHMFHIHVQLVVVSLENNTSAWSLTHQLGV